MSKHIRNTVTSNPSREDSIAALADTHCACELAEALIDDDEINTRLLEQVEALKTERDALAAHFERFENEARRYQTYSDYVRTDDFVRWHSEAPTTSLARLKAKAKAEAFENLANYAGHWTQADMLAIASDYRRQAEGGE